MMSGGQQEKWVSDQGHWMLVRVQDVAMGVMRKEGRRGLRGRYVLHRMGLDVRTKERGTP